MAIRFEYVKGYFSEGNMVTVVMEYLPQLSVNRYKTARGITKHAVKVWMQQLGDMICYVTTQKQIPFYLANTNGNTVKVEINGYFKDRRHPDLHNLAKVICDAVELGTGANDKSYRVICGQPVVNGVEPQIIVKVELE